LNRIFIVPLLIIFSLDIVFGWGKDGHMITAQLAWNQLNSEAQQSVIDFISVSYTLAEIAPWPDDYRATPEGAWSAPCHFVDLPKGATHVDMKTDCPDFCVVESIQNYTTILQGESPFQCNFGEGVEPCALEFLTHYVGDVHQPLHVSFTYDKGGNDVKIDFFGESGNLHEVWDVLIIEKWNDNWQSAAEELQEWIDQNPAISESYMADKIPLDWANESLGYVLSTVYNFTEGNSDKFTDVPYLGEVYYDRNLPIVQQRLIAGGLRLSVVLDGVFQLWDPVKN